MCLLAGKQHRRGDISFMAKDVSTNDAEFTIIYRKSFRHWRTGKIIVAPPGKVFAFKIRLKK